MGDPDARHTTGARRPPPRPCFSAGRTRNRRTVPYGTLQTGAPDPGEAAHPILPGAKGHPAIFVSKNQ